MIKFVELIFESKSQKALIKLESFFAKSLRNLKLNFNFHKLEKKHMKQRFSILKSPHVNKRAQEQFQFIKRVLKLYTATSHVFKLFKFLKTLNYTLLSHIRLKVSVEFNARPASLKILGKKDLKLNRKNILRKTFLKKHLLTLVRILEN